MKKELIKPQALIKNEDRRRFLRMGTMTVASAGLLLVGCNDEDDMGPTMPGAVNLGSGDVGILNYAYALEQLEAAFYAEVMKGGYFANASAEEKTILGDLEKHERAHREFFKAALGANAIVSLEVDFSSIDFSSRTSVLGAAKVFEDLGVAAYNGAGQYLESADLLLIAGKIVSVEARHAAAIRDLINPGSADFAGDDIIDANGLERTLNFTEVLTAAKTYVKTDIDFSQLPS
ncbi:ferritin-like domain-containing protein [Algoriphagus sp. H41]|uniref:Ferritin-like domain-containing protein n=1 Tax=Algoriphagus oliviformis TaxID=2811231 RepID=A0ABS3C5L7_9BACT|nr:ferritin-like domain-containing protein [Algoriphagus oliviformis]MBN7812145.1 ferritin-like domain-containing protein [Algoriphagus oliviformis]